MKKTLLLCPVLAGSAVLALSSLSPANAFSITSGGAVAGDGSGFTTSVAGATVVDFNSGPILPSSPYQYTNGGIVSDNPSLHAQPGGSTNTTTFYSVGPSTSEPGAILTLNGLQKYFGLYWGSIDDYNTIKFFNTTVSPSAIATYTGAQIASIVGGGAVANGGQNNPNSNLYINFLATNSSQYFNKIEFTSNGINAFESDNHAFQAVPEPLTILGSAIAMSFGVHVKRKLRREAK